MAKKEKGPKWFQKGKEGWGRAKDEDDAAKKRKGGGFLRFWIDYDTSAKLTWLDTPAFFCFEHSYQKGKSHHNYETCIKEFDTCPPCENDDRPTYIVVGTIINHTKWTDKEGAVRTNQKQLFVGKGRARQHLQKQIEYREGDMVGCVYEMSRGSITTEAGTGESFEFLKKLTKKDLKRLIPKGEDESWLEPFNYEEIFAPKTPEELRKIFGGADPVGSAKEEKDEEEPDDEKEDDKDDDTGEVQSIDDLL